MSSNHDQPAFTRRRFSLPDPKDDVLVSLAERHYQGNVSLFLRAAIEDHRDTLEGTGQGERSLHEIRSAITDFSDAQQDLRKMVEAIDERSQGTESQPNLTCLQTRHLPTPHQQVFEACRDGEQGCRFQDIVDQTGLPAKQVKTALEALIDAALLEPDTDQRYHPTATNPHRQETDQ